jgi:hypothetical protein
MMNFRRSFVVAILVSTSVSLLACTAGVDSGDGSPGSGASAETAAPLLDRCSGTYTCTSDGKTASITLNRDVIGCYAGDVVFDERHDVTTDAGGHQKLATWAGDSRAFDICAADGCMHCTDDAAGIAPAGGPSPSGSCSGSTSCSYFQPGDCGSHTGCWMDSHAVYSNGYVDHYEYTCRGTTPACSSHTTAEECKRQDCTWK